MKEDLRVIYIKPDEGYWNKFMFELENIPFYYKIKNFFKGISNLWKWRKIIWKDRDWDETFLIDILSLKLQNIANYFENKTNTNGYDFHNNEYKAQRIRTILKLMDRVYDGYYESEYFEKLEKIYGPYEFEFVKVDNEKYEIQRVWENNYSERELSEISKIEYRLMNESKNKQEKAHRLLWKMIEFYIQTWWE
jgi:hypothetical protein